MVSTIHMLDMQDKYHSSILVSFMFFLGHVMVFANIFSENCRLLINHTFQITIRHLFKATTRSYFLYSFWYLDLIQTCYHHNNISIITVYHLNIMTIPQSLNCLFPDFIHNKIFIFFLISNHYQINCKITLTLLIYYVLIFLMAGKFKKRFILFLFILQARFLIFFLNSA